MRQLGLASHMYVMDNEDFLPNGSFGGGFFFATYVAPYLAVPPIDPTKLTDINYLTSVYTKVAVFRCPSWPRNAQVTDYGLQYTINNINFDAYVKSKQYGPATFQKVSAVPGSISEVAFIVELVVANKDFVNFDVFKPDHATFNARGAPNFDPRMIKHPIGATPGARQYHLWMATVRREISQRKGCLSRSSIRSSRDRT